MGNFLGRTYICGTHFKPLNDLCESDSSDSENWLFNKKSKEGVFSLHFAEVNNFFLRGNLAIKNLIEMSVRKTFR